MNGDANLVSILNEILKVLSRQTWNVVQDDDGDTKIVCNSDDSIDVYNNGIKTTTITSNGIITHQKQSAVFMRISAIQSTTATAGWERVSLDTVVFDIQGDEADTTNHRITIKEDGIYLALGGVGVSVSDGVNYGVGIFKNGTNICSNVIIAGGNGTNEYKASVIVQADAGDYFEVDVYHGDNVSRSVGYGANQTFLQLIKIA